MRSNRACSCSKPTTAAGHTWSPASAKKKCCPPRPQKDDDDAARAAAEAPAAGRNPPPPAMSKTARRPKRPTQCPRKRSTKSSFPGRKNEPRGERKLQIGHCKLKIAN